MQSYRRPPETVTIPGAVDLHVHFREPGTNKAETFASGTKAALKGGFVLVCDMPNNPGRPTWTLRRLEDKHRRITAKANIPVLTYAGAQPESNNLDELKKMAEKSVGLKLYAAVTTGNEREYRARDFRKIVKTWHAVAPKKPIMLHAGKDNLGQFIRLVAKKNNHHLHVCHVNNPDEARMVARYKRRGLPLTCGVCPHHLFMSSHDELSKGWFAKMQPPLSSQKDSQELFKLLINGDIDVLETDHAPHSLNNKWIAENGGSECYGVPGIEFALPLLFYQMKQRRISLKRIVEVTSTMPAKIIGVKISPKTKVVWEMKEYRINEDLVVSKSGWTPYNGMLAVGKVKKVTINGNPVAS